MEILQFGRWLTLNSGRIKKLNKRAADAGTHVSEGKDVNRDFARLCVEVVRAKKQDLPILFTDGR